MISSRKEEHVRLAVDEKVGFRTRTNGLDDVELAYNALPEIDFSQIVVNTMLAGRPLSMPLVITGMTGGYADAERINEGLAACAVELGVALSVGSMRAAVVDPTCKASYSVVRGAASAVPLLSNIGAVQLAEWHNDGSLADHIGMLIELIDASVFGIHLNPLQELLQPEGEPRFAGVLEAIIHTVESCPIPVLVKEVGAGIGGVVGNQLVHAGVQIIDVGGAGGTSWAGIEIMRRHDHEDLSSFWDVGISTADCVRQLVSLREQYSIPDAHKPEPPTPPFPTIIASGGIASGGHLARALALGADLCGTARPAIQALEQGGNSAVMTMVRSWEQDLKRWMFITGSRTLGELHQCWRGHA